MKEDTGRRPITLVLVAAALVFGMVLAGGMNLAPKSFAESNDTSEHAVKVETPISNGLPGFADLAEAVSPAVVSIQATKIERRGGGDPRGQDPFEFFFGPRGRDRGERQPQRADSSGSGFVISADGLVVTNHHVIEDAESLTVFLNGREYPATVKGDDPATDIALLKIDPEEPLTYLELSSSDTLRVGDWIMVIGSPLQLDNSVSVGVVSAKGRSINITPDSSLENFIQTDAAINFGNSGGPLVNLKGEVVGIATAINFGAENIGFAVPVDTLLTILPQLRDTGVVRRGYLGVNIVDLGYEEAEAFGLKSTDGALVTRVMENSPAEDAGLKYGDIIVEVNGKRISSNRELIDYVSARPPGEKVKLRAFRNGDYVDVELTLGERPGVDVPVVETREEESSEIDWLGIKYQDIDNQTRQNHSMPDELEGVWVTQVAPDSPLYDKGVRPGDVIVDVNGNKITSGKDLESVAGEVPSGQFLRIYLNRIDPRSGVANSYFAVIRVP